MARENGIEHVIVPTSPEYDFRPAGEAIAGDNGGAVVYDGVAGPILQKLLDVLRPRGLAAVLGNAGGKAPPIDVHSLKAKSLVVTSPGLGHFTGIPEDLAGSANALFEVLRSGGLKAAPRHRGPLAEARHAHADLEGRRTSGACVLLVA